MSHTDTALRDMESLELMQPETLVDAEADSIPSPAAQQPPSKALRILLGLSLVLIAANLRPVFSSVSVLLPEIIEATGMSSIAAGVLTTLPVVCLGLFAPFAPRLAQRFGAERVLLFALLVLTVGTALRGIGTFPRSISARRWPVPPSPPAMCFCPVSSSAISRKPQPS